MRSKEDFRSVWRKQWGALYFFGSTADIKDGNLAKAARYMAVPGEIDRMIDMMYDELTKQPQQPKGAK